MRYNRGERGILDYCIDAGVYGIICFEMGMTLRAGDREYLQTVTKIPLDR